MTELAEPFDLVPQRQVVVSSPSPEPTQDPKRDWRLGPLTGHRLQTVFCMVVTCLVLYQLQAWVWPRHSSAHGVLEVTWGWGAVLWLGAVLPGALGMIGMLLFRHPDDLDEVEPIEQLVCWRIVSRGTNAEALAATIRRCQAEMRRTPLFDYIIEVVTDCKPLHMPPPNDDLRYLEVPSGYQTENHTKFKARGLQYALEHSPLSDDAWIVHLDEETQPTTSGIKGIARMIMEEEARATELGVKPRIGQGAILYHRDWKRHPFLTLADNVRTGDDFARFHFEHRLGRTIFGLHGSYIVVRNDVEKVGGFDFGPRGSITEDAFWALVCMEAGYRCRWVEGYLEEQSTQSVMDFVRQRRRWFQGLALVALFAPVKLRWRVSLGVNTALWALAPFAMLYTFIHFFYGPSVMPWIQALANGSLASFATLYVVGLRANLDEYGITSRPKRLGWYVAQVALLPVFTVMESAGVLLAIVKPVKGFHVVQK